MENLLYAVSRIRDAYPGSEFFHPGSRILGSKRPLITDPDSKKWLIACRILLYILHIFDYSVGHYCRSVKYFLAFCVMIVHCSGWVPVPIFCTVISGFLTLHFSRCCRVEDPTLFGSLHLFIRVTDFRIRIIFVIRIWILFVIRMRIWVMKMAFKKFFLHIFLSFFTRRTGTF